MGDDEDEITDAVENLCSPTKDEGKWITKLDIYQNTPGAHLSLDRSDIEGMCNNECKAVQRACSTSLKGKEESLVSQIRDGAGVGKLQRDVCKKACAKSVPELGEWEDETWTSAAPPPTPAPPPATPAPGAEDMPERLAEIVPDVVAHGLHGSGVSLFTDDINHCFNEVEALKTASDQFLKDTLAGIRDMMRKETDAMREGLSTVVRAMGKLNEAFKDNCSKVTEHAAKVQMLAEKFFMSVFKNKEIVYEPLKSLKVNGVDIHKLVNSFIAAWKKEPADGAGIGKALVQLLSQDYKPAADAGVSASDKAEL